MGVLAGLLQYHREYGARGDNRNSALDIVGLGGSGAESDSGDPSGPAGARRICRKQRL
jgi:hypothetical protein